MVASCTQQNIIILFWKYLVDNRSEAWLNLFLECSVDHQVNKKRKIKHTANEGPVRIQYKGLAPIYVFTEMKLLFPKQNFMFCLPAPTLIYLLGIYIYFQDRSVWCRKYVDLFLEYINRSWTHECGNWD